MTAKPVGLFSKVTSHRADKEMMEEKKYEFKDDDGNINFTGEHHQLDDTENISRTNINDGGWKINIIESGLWTKIEVNIQPGHGPSKIKLAHCFWLAVQFITFLLF